MEGLGCSVEDKPAFQQEFLDLCEPGGAKCITLFFNCHVQLGVRHAAFSMEVIADEIGAPWQEKLANLGVECCCVALVPEFVNRLMGYCEIEVAEAFTPIFFSEIALGELDTGGKGAEALLGKLMHCGREVERHIEQLWIRSEQLLSQESWARTQLNDAAWLRGT